MRRSLLRIRGALGMGLTGAGIWGLAGALTGVTSLLVPAVLRAPFFQVFDAPLPALAVPGFFGGLFFSLVLRIAGGGRRFGDLSLPRFAAWGAAGGVLLSLFPTLLVMVGLATAASPESVWPATATIAGPFILLSAASASISLLLGRRAERHRTGDTGAEAADAELAAGETLELRDPGPALSTSTPSRGRERVRVLNR